MKKFSTLFLLAFVFVGGVGRAQSPMSIPNGSFEQWSSHPGYSVTIMYFPLSVYDTFSTPSIWSYPSYPVNETVSFSGMSVNVNTSIPLVKTTRESGSVPDGNRAVRLQSIMLEDIVNPMVLTLAGDYIDSTLTQQVIPSILLTGEANIEAMIPLLSDMASGANITTMINTLLAEDVNDYVTGGLALGAFQPGRLTGSYKYHSAVSGDNGAVMMIGTRYNSVTQRREVVGGGYTLDLVDTGDYTPFEVAYLPLDSLVPGSTSYPPDSLIVFLFSSAGENMQQGSYLILDDLMLWSVASDTTDTDTCATVLDLMVGNTVADGFPMMRLEWRGSSQPDHWEVEYGPQGFAPGTGTAVTTTETFFNIYPLEQAGTLSPNTWYDFYVRSACDEDVYGNWDLVHYRTFCAMVGSLTVDGDSLSVTADNRIDGYSASWVDTTDTRQWGVYYGIYSSEFPDTWGTYVTVDTPYFAFPPLSPDMQYTITVSALCGDENYGDEVGASFHTPALEGIDQLSTLNSQLSILPNPAQGRCTVTLADNQSAELKLYTIDGRLMQTVATDGAPVVLTLPAPGLYLLHATTASGTTTCKIVSR